jgi:hypothetical protein
MFDTTFLLTGYAASTPTLADNVRFLTTYPHPIANIGASAMSMSARSTRRTITPSTISSSGADPATSATAEVPPTPVDSSTEPVVIIHGNKISFTASTYGSSIPIVYGTSRLTGNVIWSTDYKTHFITVNKIKYYYTTVSFALALCEGPIDRVLKIWIGDKVYYDKTATTSAGGKVTAKNGVILSQTIDLTSPKSPLRKAKASLRKTKVSVFNGAENQVRAGAMAAAFDYENSPAYRGIAYIEFDNFLVANHQLPVIEVEVMAKAAAITPRAVGISPALTGLGKARLRGAVMDPSYGHIVTFEPVVGTSATPRVNTFRNDTMELYSRDVVSAAIPYVSPAYGSGTTAFGDISAFWPDSNGRLLLADVKTVPTQTTLFLYNMFSGAIDHISGPNGYIGGGLFQPLGVGSCLVRAHGSQGIPTDVFIGAPKGTMDIWFAELDPDTPKLNISRCLVDATNLKARNWLAPISIDTEFAGKTKKLADKSSSLGVHVFVFAQTVTGTSNFTISRLTIDNGTGTITVNNASLKAFGTIDLDDLGGNGFAHQIIASFQDPSDNCVVLKVFAAGDDDDYILKWSPFTNTVLWSTPVGKFRVNPDQSPPNTPSPALMNGSTYAFLTTNQGTIIDLDDGKILTDNVPLTDLPNGALEFYNGDEDSILYTSDTVDEEVVKVFIGRTVRSSVAVSSILGDLLRRTGMSSLDYVVDDLALISTRGYTITQTPKTVKSALDDLSTIFPFDVIETGGQVKYKSRGDTSVATIPSAHLGSVNGEGWLNQTVTEDFSRSRKIAITYQDISRSYLPNTQTVILPILDPGLDSESPIQISTEVALYGAEARRIAEVLLTAKNAYTKIYSGVLPPRYRTLEPGDTVTLQRNDSGSQSVVARLRDTSLGVDRSTQFTAVREDPTIYNDLVNLLGHDGIDLSEDLNNFPGRIDPIILQIPFRSEEEAKEQGSSYYLFMALLNIDPNADISDLSGDTRVRLNGIELYTITADLAFATWGYCRNALPASVAIYSIDPDTVLTVLASNTGDIDFASAFDEATLVENPTVNLCYIGGELIQFKTVIDNGDGTLSLRNLLRAKFGTEHAAFNHVPGETLILLGDKDGNLSTNIARIDVPTSIGFPKSAAQITLASANPYQPSPTVYWTALNLRPFQVQNVVGAYASGDVVASWDSQTRFDGDWEDFTETIPLNEASEEYLVYFYTNPSTFNPQIPTTYLRTKTVASPTVTYTDADQSTDGFNRNTTDLYFLIYQAGSTTGVDNGAGIEYHLAHL